MAVIEGGVSAELTGVGLEAAKPAHITSKPIPYGALGHYRVQVVTGTLAAALAASAQVWQLKNPTTNLIIINHLRIRFLPLTPFTAATLTDHTSFDAFIARAITGGGGGTTVTLTGNNAKMRTSMATTGAVINVSTTAALTALTGLDAIPFAQSIRKGNRVNPAAATEEINQPTDNGMDLDFDMGSGDHPIVLENNEAILIRNRTVWPAAGTGILSILCSWVETTTF